MRFTRLTIVLVALALTGVGGGQAIWGFAHQNRSSAGTSALHVSGVGLDARQFDAVALGGLARTTVTVKDKEGVDVVYEGARVSDILASAGMTFGQSLRGPRLADYLLAEAGDGYRVVFALPEFDPEFSDRVIIVADRCDGQPLTGRDGPLKIIVSDEKRHARWVRNVTRLAVLSAPKEAPATAPAPDAEPSRSPSDL